MKEKEVSLPDNIAIAAQKKAEKKAQLMTEIRSAKTPKAEKKPTKISPQDDTVGDSQEPLED